MRYLIIIFICLSSFVAQAVPKKDLEKAHHLNYSVAKMLNFKNPANYHKIRKSLKSAKDKAILKKFYLKKKTSKVKIFPMLDNLLIYENGRQTWFKIVSLNPMKIRVNNQGVYQLDPNNIWKSYRKYTFKKKRKSAGLLGLLIPDAVANIFTRGYNAVMGEPVDWEEVYAMSLLAENNGGYAPLRDPNVPETMRNVASYMGIENINCDAPNPTGFNSRRNLFTTASVQLSLEGGNSAILNCDTVGENCRVDLYNPETQRVYLGSDDMLSNGYDFMNTNIERIRELSGISDFDPNDYNLSCRTRPCRIVPNAATAQAADNGWGFRSYSDGNTLRSEPISTEEFERRRDALYGLDLNQLTEGYGNRDNRAAIERQMEYFQRQRRFSLPDYNTEEGEWTMSGQGVAQAMSAFAACCSAPGCPEAISGRGGIQMTPGNSYPTDQ